MVYNNGLIETEIKNKIHSIRGLQVMLDSDLAELYHVEVRRLNEQVKRNSSRFPAQFMFQLTESEFHSLRSQFAISKGKGKHRKYLPYVFTEQGVSMLSAVLRSKTAIEVSIQIINTFVAMRRFLSQNAGIFQRLDLVEKKQLENDIQFAKIFATLEDKSITPKKGIFFEGQIFDAYLFFSNLIKSANKSIILIDNYIDESVLILFSKRNKDVKTTIYTQNTTKQLGLDLRKYNSQYPFIEIKKFESSHDRFLIIDGHTVYHIGASLKDLGKKWFAFSKFNTEVLNILSRLPK